MVRIDPDTLYSRTDLVEVLAPLGINPDFFVARLKPRKVFRAAYLGSDLLDALRSAHPLGEDAALPKPRSKGGCKAAATDQVGRFSKEELGL